MLPRSSSSKNPLSGSCAWIAGTCTPAAAKQRRNVQERTAVFLLRRRVHGDETAPVGEAGAEIAPEARILRCRGQREGNVRKLCADPTFERGKPEIHCEVRGIMTLFILKKRARIYPHMQHRPARLATLHPAVLSGAQFAWAQCACARAAGKAKGPTTIDAESIEGVSELEMTARGKVEFQREDLTIYSEYLRYNQEFGRIEADGGVRMLRGARPLLRPAPALQHPGRHGRVRGLELHHPGRDHDDARHGRTARIPRQGQDPDGERHVYHLRARQGGLALRGARARARQRQAGRHGARRPAQVLRHHDTAGALRFVLARQPAQVGFSGALLFAQHARAASSSGCRTTGTSRRSGISS